MRPVGRSLLDENATIAVQMSQKEVGSAMVARAHETILLSGFEESLGDTPELHQLTTVTKGKRDRLA